MYKIYINDSPLILCPTEKVSLLTNADRKQLVVKYTLKKKSLLNYIDMMEKGDEYDEVIIHSTEYEQLKKEVKGLYKIIPAAGGLVLNEESEIMFIFRRGFWDLPKGKIDPNEKKKKAAIREVEEETGIRDMLIAGKIGKSNHSYRNKSGKRILKVTHWYLMNTYKQESTPQTEEDIVKAEWMTLQHFYEEERPVYSNILEILDLYQMRISSDNNFVPYF
jgi:8-oxo-dGTP pyrophosphatase MutT (NUDIX family)